ncbi:hypothetical protein R1flu_015618 [Riccia fluitans]|uniref:Cytochrome P450 n=1 Tax=Riccia fluitans TaxID=41844 RepID=A0ABD1YJJ3_9MARC
MASLSTAAAAGVSCSCIAGPLSPGMDLRCSNFNSIRLQNKLWGQNFKLVKRRSESTTTKSRRVPAAVLDEKPSESSKPVASILNSEGIDEELAARIASGEFTAPAAQRNDQLVGLRKVLANAGPPGRFLSLALANLERRMNQASLMTMPVAKGDARKIVGQPFFVPLYTLFKTYGGVFRLSFGPKNFIIVSDPDVTKRILKDNAKGYSKGILAEILEFVMGTGLIPADGEIWKVRRRAIVPSLHMKYVMAMLGLFGECTQRLCDKLHVAASNGDDVEMESLYSRLTLDVIGKAVFNYDFDSLSNDTGIVEAVYVTLREAEDRSVGIVPYWKIPILAAIDPRQQRVAKALKLVNETLDSLIDKCKKIVEEEDDEFTEDYINERDPSILHFLLASGDEVTSKQLRDDLMTMLIAGHETSAAVLTWTTYLLSLNPPVTAKLQREVDTVLGDRAPSIDDIKKLRYTTAIINESMRLYPQPPVLIRRALEDDMLGQYLLRKGEDIFISVWNLHRSPDLWEDPDAFRPERWDTFSAAEASQAFRFIPFGGGPRKCVGDVFATFEVVTALAMLARRFDFQIAAGAPPVLMTTGATIHTTNGLHMTVTQRTRAPVIPMTDIPSLTTVDENGVIKTYRGSDGSISVVGSASKASPGQVVTQTSSNPQEQR